MFDVIENPSLPLTRIVTCSSFDKFKKVSSYGPQDYQDDPYFNHPYNETGLVLRTNFNSKNEGGQSIYSKVFYPIRHRGGIEHAGLIVLELEEGHAYISEIDPLGKNIYVSTKNSTIEGIKKALKDADPGIEIHEVAHNKVIQENNSACGVHLLANMQELLDVPNVYEYISQNQLTKRSFLEAKDLFNKLKISAKEDAKTISKFMAESP